MRVNQGFLGWGVFFIAAGAIGLALQAGYVAEQSWWTFWPLILVGAGLGLILGKTPFEFVGGVVVAATMGIIVGGSLSSGFIGFGDVTGGVCRVGDEARAFADRSGSFGPEAEVSIELDCGTVTVETVSGAGWAVRGTDGDGRGPDIESFDASLEVDPPDGQLSAAAWLIDLPTESTLDLDLQLNAGQLRASLADGRLNLVDLEVNAGQANLDLTGVRDIDGIDVGVNAGQVGVTLPSQPMTGSIEVNAGSVRLCVPDDVAVRLATEVVLGGIDVGDSGLVRVTGGWQSPDYDTASTRIELRLTANLGSVRIDPSEGCT